MSVCALYETIKGRTPPALCMHYACKFVTGEKRSGEKNNSNGEILVEKQRVNIHL